MRAIAYNPIQYLSGMGIQDWTRDMPSPVADAQHRLLSLHFLTSGMQHPKASFAPTQHKSSQTEIEGFETSESCVICRDASGTWTLQGSSVPLTTAVVQQCQVYGKKQGGKETSRIVIKLPPHRFRDWAKYAGAETKELRRLSGDTLLCVLKVCWHSNNFQESSAIQWHIWILASHIPAKLPDSQPSTRFRVAGCCTATPRTLQIPISFLLCDEMGQTARAAVNCASSVCFGCGFGFGEARRFTASFKVCLRGGDASSVAPSLVVVSQLRRGSCASEE